MHLLAATPGQTDEGQEPVDLGQTPAEVLVLSAADTELALLSEARAAMADPPGLRLANLTHLRHPMSVDLHVEACASRCRVVIARLLGGAGYWRYGLAQYSARLHEARVPVAFLPGDDKPDPELRALSTLADEEYDALWSCLVEGGPENATRFLARARALARDTPDRPPPAKPLLKAGLYWPGDTDPDLAALRAHWQDGAPIVPVVFYRALLQGAGLAPIARLTRSLLRAGLAPLPVYVSSLKDPLSAALLAETFAEAPPDVILNATAFATGTPSGDGAGNPLTGPHGAPVYQIVLSGGTEEAWSDGLAGLSARDIAMNVALPEIDGRILSRAISFKDAAGFDEATQCPIAAYRPRGDRIDFVTQLAANTARLRRTAAADRRVALVLANYPNKDGRLANGVGLDTPAASAHALHLLQEAGYTTDPPADGVTLMDRLLAGPTNWLPDRASKEGGERLPLATYRTWFDALPWDAKSRILDRWGPPETDPFLIWPEILPSGNRPDTGAAFALSIHRFGNVTVGLQPARGYNIDPEETYHSPDLVPPHGYLAFYLWLREHWDAHAIVHMGKHGNLEWLPGKALALSQTCWPEIALGPMPHIYPFIVNDPGEGTQAKRRAQAVIVDHLTPPLTRAETYGPLRDLEALVDEYYEAAGLDPARAARLREQILSLSQSTGLASDAGLRGEAETDLAKLDAWLCELKEAQIRDGLHVFGQSPDGALARDLAIALARVPRGDGKGPDASLQRALASDLGLSLDPLDCDMAAPAAEKPEVLAHLTSDPWRTNGDTVERLELLSRRLVDALRDGGRGDGGAERRPAGPASAAVLAELETRILPTVAACGPAEGTALLTALAGRAIPPAPLAPPPGAASTRSPPAATSSPSTAAPSLRRRPGPWAGSPRTC